MEFIFHFGALADPKVLTVLFLGTIGGLVLGAMPGLSPTMAVALLIPFTFRLPATEGLILLGAVYTSTVAGGAVSAILLNVPGAPANIATTFDGFPMARNGEGKRALHLAFLSSAIGGVVGVLLLIFLTPVLAGWALAFGPAAMFWLAMLGVTIIGSLGSKSVLKGLIGGCFGLWISTIGFDDILGAKRFVFHDALDGGINLIAAMIGLFAIPQVLTMLGKGRRIDTVEVMHVGNHPLIQSFRETLSNTRAVIIGSVSGAFVGVVPGIGGQIAGLLAYDQSRKFSGKKEEFGTGRPEGVISVETANSAMVGTSLIPLLTLSIPGSPTAAVLLGGLLINGIFPGPTIFVTHPDVVWTFINSMLVGQILMCLFGIMIAGFAARVALLPRQIMAASVFGLAVFGSYSVQQSMGDVYIMVVLGVGMFFAERFAFSAAPVVLGLILGPIAEANFIQGSMIANAADGMFDYFFTGTLNIVFIALILASITYSVSSEIANRSASRSGKKT